MTTYTAGRVARGIVLVWLALYIPPEARADDRVGDSTEPRVRYSINDNWAFYPDGVDFAMYPTFSDAGWERVSIPHTWNASDPFDDKDSYRRGISWYRKNLRLSDDLRGKRLHLYFEGVNQEADVYVNGAYAGSHKGGYTAFAFDITEFVTFDGAHNENLIAVQVDNSHDPLIPPLSVGFALYGGIYRDVWLVATDPIHFDVTERAGPGVFTSTPAVSREEATVAFRGTIVNDGETLESIRVVSRISTPGGELVAETASELAVQPEDQVTFSHADVTVPQPRLWSPADPYLYEAVTEIVSGGRVLDRVRHPLGLRWFRFDAQEGFSLNGEKLQLRGTNRHQDYAGLGSALSDELHRRDLEWIKEMGANFVRLAHYPQDPAVLDAADRLGLLVWEEIPLVNYMTDSPEFVETSAEMLREMIRQHFNHPSVILWGSMNEIFLWSEEGARLGQHTDRAYAREVLALATTLDSLIRAEDPGRYTAMAIHANGWYADTGVEDVPEVLGINMYNGWYGGTFDGFGAALDRRHESNPDQVIFVSEYGAGSDERIHSLEPERFDFSVNWARMYHEEYLRQINERPFLAGTAVWNQFDFSQPHTGGSIPHLNQKGLQTWDRRPKDSYYLYKANWNAEPMVYIASREWTQRHGAGSLPSEQPVDVYSNLDSIELIVNGRSLGSKAPDEVMKATWQVPFVEGRNIVEARGERDGEPVEDRLAIHLTHRAADLSEALAEKGSVLALNVGSHARYVDGSGTTWEADRPFMSEGHVGHVGGERGMIDKDFILESTTDTPLYLTYQSDLEGYRFDVPDGTYEIELRFAEPLRLQAGDRVFSVDVNDRRILSNVDLSRDDGFARASAVSFQAMAEAGQGLNLSFTASSGVPLLNAVRITRK